MLRNEKKSAEHSGFRIKIPSNSLDLLAMCREYGQYRSPLPTIDCHKKHGRCPPPPPKNSKNIPLEGIWWFLDFFQTLSGISFFFLVGDFSYPQVTILPLRIFGRRRERQKTFLREGGVCQSQKMHFHFRLSKPRTKKIRWRNSSSSIMDDNFLFVSPNTTVDFPIISA